MSTPVTPKPGGTYPIEPKVKWMTAVTYVLGVVGVAAFNGITQGTFLADVLPDAIEIFVFPLIPTIGSLIAGFSASHQWRTGEGVQ